MARIRTIKPEFPHSESMGKISRDARLTFIQLWTLADDSGRLRGASRMLASLLFPYDDDAPSLIESWLSELERERCIVRYCIDGTQCLQVLNWLNHQKIDKPTPSKLPAFVESSRILANPRERSSGDLDQGSRIKEGIKDQGPRVSIPSVSHSASAEDVRKVFEHWKVTWNHPKTALDPKRTATIKRALKGYSATDLCTSISGYLNSTHHTGQNDRNAVYDGLNVFLRDSDHIDAGLRFARDPPVLSSKLQQHNVAVLKDWIPPELRNAPTGLPEVSDDHGELERDLRQRTLAAPH